MNLAPRQVAGVWVQPVDMTLSPIPRNICQSCCMNHLSAVDCMGIDCMNVYFIPIEDPTMLQSNDPVPYTALATVERDHYDRNEEILQCAARILRARMERQSTALTDPILVGDLLCTRIGGNAVESLGVMFLDTQHRLIELEELFTGTPDSCNISTSHIIRQCVHYRATNIILYHNHPSGVTTPSEADYKMTSRIIDALKAVDVTVLDHLVVSGTEHASLRKLRGHLFS